MWDLETLRRLNEQAYLSSQKMINDRLAQTAKPAYNPVFPLSILALKLIVGPPSLSRLIDILEDSDSIAYFLELIREYLPEYEDDIMSEVDDMGRIQRFSEYFSWRYLPLSEIQTYYDDITISDFVRAIPVDLLGFNYDDYEEFNSYRNGYILLLSIIESPYEDTGRVPLLERVKELVGKMLVELIPAQGWSLEHIHRMIDGTEYEGCAVFADWVFSNTGYWQLDANYTDYTMEAWSRRVVDGLTEQWPMVIDLQEKMQRMYEWLEEDMYHNFKKLLTAIIGIEYEEVPKEQIPFPLDDEGQVIRKEVDVSGR